jgi:hypothetical protein
MRAFIVRPFGTQQEIDFDRVQRELIEPALEHLRQQGMAIDGGTTGLISSAGNIRQDMFRLLAVSELVIADVTIHNANAFYELGVRHALRPGCTHLIRAKGGKFKYPFDLQTDRYFEYDLENLAGDVDALAQGLRATLAERRDSPIFLLLKDLKPHERGDLVKVPEGFREDVELARNTGRRGDLRLLAHESGAFEWDREGLALVGEAQLKLRAYEGAKDTFDLLRIAAPNDYQANWRLGTIFQRLASTRTGAEKEDLTTRSEQAIERALSVAETPAQKAELNGMLGSNVKNRWIDDYRGDGSEPSGQRALTSPCLGVMIECYLRATGFDLDEHYPAINALAFLKVQTALARRFPDDWAGMNENDAEGILKKREELASRLTANLRLSLRLDDVFKAYQSAANAWCNSSIADLVLLSDPANTSAITNRYRVANSSADRFSLEANRRNLDIFKELGLFEPGVSAAIKVIEEETRKRAPAEAQLKRALLFTGHMVDAPDRPADKARFPRTAKAEQLARQLILDAVKKEVGADAASTVGIAGAASGGDILFHEVCAELGIQTRVYLALPPSQFQTESVEPAGEAWVARYQALCQATKELRVLQKSKASPDWLAGLEDYNLWERNNLWMLFNTLATGAVRQTLIALFNEDREPDGAGGTKHLLKVAKKHGLRTVAVDARPLLT